MTSLKMRILHICMIGKAAHQRQFCLGFMLGITSAFIIAGLYMLPLNVVHIRSLVPALTTHEKWDKYLQDRENVGVSIFDLHDEKSHNDDTTEADRLFNEVRVLVWVMTAPNNLQKKARVVRDTWGRRSNVLLFFSSETNTSFPTIGLNVSEGREHLTAKTMKAFQYIYHNHFDSADWFMKVDDDTYVIMENLRYFLSNENTSEPVFFGHHFKVLVAQGYYSGGGGYVISKEALRRFGERTNTSACRQDGGDEDVEFGKCMQSLGVRTKNSTDALGRSRFHCFDPESFLNEPPKWYFHYDANGAKKGPGSISDYSISFHYVSPEKMNALEYYTYHLTPFGIVKGRQNINRPHVTITPNFAENTTQN